MDPASRTLARVTLPRAEEHEAGETALQQHRSNIFWLSAIAVVSGLINVAVFVGIFLLKG